MWGFHFPNRRKATALFFGAITMVITLGPTAAIDNTRDAIAFVGVSPPEWFTASHLSGYVPWIGFPLILALLAWGFWPHRKDARPDQAGDALDRPLSMQDFELVAVRNDAELAVEGYKLVVKNFGDGMVRWRLELSKMSIDDLLILQSENWEGWHYVNRTQSSHVGQTRKDGPVRLEPHARTVAVEIQIEYDTVPPTGLRKSYVKVGFDVLPPGGADFRQSVLEQRELP